MTLTLRAVSLNDRPLTQPITAHFDAGGGSIGRADHNTLALPDPERYISRQHAEIRADAAGYTIRNVGSANPISVRGQALGRGESAPLSDRDQIRIGGYLLEVIQEVTPGIEAETIVRGRAAVDAATPGVIRSAALASGRGAAASRSAVAASSAATPFGEMNTSLSRSNSFASLFGKPVPVAAPAAAPAFASSRDSTANFIDDSNSAVDSTSDADADAEAAATAWAAAPAPAPPRPLLLPDDFDPFAPAASAPINDLRPAGSVAGAFDDLIPSAGPSSIDDAFGLARSGSADHGDPLAGFMADLALQPPAAAAGTPHRASEISTDPFEILGFTSPDRRARNDEPIRSDHVPQLNAAFVPPALRPPPAVDASPAIAADALGNAPSADAQALWAAFCEGAGITVQAPGQGIDAASMRNVGALLQAAVAGTLQLMMARATAKHELRAQVTVIQARNNNPLKFSPDARSALEQLLMQPPLRGFLAGPAAITDAMHDLIGHAIGTMAGTRAALEGVLDRFSPQQLGAKLTDRSMLDSVLPMNRKAKLWELYLQHYDAIRNEAHDDFHSLFGRAFLAAYEQQLDRLQRDADQPA